MRHRLGIFLLLLAFAIGARAQGLRTYDGARGSAGGFGNNRSTGFNGGSDYGFNDEDPDSTRTKKDKIWGRREGKKEEPTPVGVSQWRVDELNGDSLAAENMDTVVHNFQFWNMTEGQNGEYTILGNLGSPRLSRLFLHRTADDPFVFFRPYDYFLNGQDGFRFSNTKSPLTNLAYHKMGNRTNGSERFRAYFASNINKRSGIGFKVDYLYGRGMFNSQTNSMLSGTFFGYHLGERYQIHSYIDLTHNKMAENGGLESDVYITDPQSMPRTYGSRDIPTALTETWNRNDGETYFLTHRYRMGFYRDVELPDSLKPEMPGDFELLGELPDSLQQALAADSVLRIRTVDSLRLAWQQAQVPPREFVPVSAVNHSFRARTMRHRFYSYADELMNYHTTLYYAEPTNVRDRIDGLEIENTLSLSMLEGFNKWAAMGINLFATHHFEAYKQPERVNDTVAVKRHTEQNLYLGGRITRTQGTLLHYDAVARVVAAGDYIGDFDVNATINLNFRLGRKDTIALTARGYVKNEKPAYLLRHMHTRFAWVENDGMNREFRTRIEGTLADRRTKTSLTVGVENIKNYAYLGIESTLKEGHTAGTLTADYTREVRSRQYTGSIQLLAVGLRQDFNFWKPLHWDNEVWFQTTSKPDILPLPSWNIYSNLYLKFRIAKTLNVQLGGDIRYFTAYYAPDYSPVANAFAVQDAAQPRVKIGNYPIVNVYANLHLKRCRLYVCARHVNSGTGRRFWAPHYAMDPLTINFGLSWNFFN